MREKAGGLCVITAIFLHLIACSQKPVPVTPNRPILKIAVMADGTIKVNGSPATIEALRASLKRLAEERGVVWYYREAGQSKAPPEAMEVVQAVIENRLPIRLSSRPDYSDSIGLDGKPIPAQKAPN